MGLEFCLGVGSGFWVWFCYWGGYVGAVLLQLLLDNMSSIRAHFLAVGFYLWVFDM